MKNLTSNKFLQINLDFKKGWHKINAENHTLLFKGYLNNTTKQILLKNFLNAKFDIKKTKETFKNLDGHYTLIFFNKENFILGSDRICSIPLILNSNKNKFKIADNFRNIMALINKKFIPQFNSDQHKFFTMSGYTFGENSLFKEFFSTHAGYCYVFKNKEFNKIKYYNWQPYKKKSYNKERAKTELKKINHDIINKLIKSSRGKCIVIPLSAGYDSRFILSGLINKGYKNIFTFSYGRQNNRDKLIAQKIANFLKIPWIYVEYNNKKIKYAMLSNAYNKFKEFSDVTNSIHFPQDYYAIKYLKKHKLITNDSIIVNGQTGDFISGNHIPINSNKDNFEKLINKFLYKHFKMSNKLLEDNLCFINQSLRKRICSFKININSLNEISGALEKIECEDRQSKYVMSGQRTYEFFDFQWRLPLWDKEYMDFWEKIDTKFKINQNLYKEVLIEENWCNVWRKFPLNPKPTFTNDITIMRFFFKSIFFFLGKKNWHKFEVKYLDYYLSTLCGYAIWKYSKIIFDKRGFTSPLSWHIEEYLKNKGIKWDGKIKK